VAALLRSFIYNATTINFLRNAYNIQAKEKKKEKNFSLMQNDGTPSHDGGGERTKVTAESFWFVRIDTPD